MIGAAGIKAVAGPRWSQKRLTGMLVDCFGPGPGGGVDVEAVAEFSNVSTSTVRRWLTLRGPAGRRVPAIPRQRLERLQRGPVLVERRNAEQYRHAMAALNDFSDGVEGKAIPVSWLTRGWLDEHAVIVAAIFNKPWYQVLLTNGAPTSLLALQRRGEPMDLIVVPTRFHAQVIVYAVMQRLQHWRVHPAEHELIHGRTQVWMDDAPPADLSGIYRRCFPDLPPPAVPAPAARLL
ncbi:hypothetical protein [Mycobacteroides abscessus]|uniref:hypothetical protein n=1 Tax=Mycobacteroides abscessus TaxID=36809 RepID=UPI000928791A|nr:hypothetical protein [Mycobacteroides abscessus]SIE16460.1 Uncharacterised protein [Mycobacteroides abscessus subsp. abscessus]